MKLRYGKPEYQLSMNKQSTAPANKDRCNTDVLAGMLSKEKKGN